MTKKILYKITPPIGHIVVPSEHMTEEQVRDFFFQIIQTPPMTDNTWAEKASKDPIADLLEWLKRGGYAVEIIEPQS